jgi:hypothetical protein
MVLATRPALEVRPDRSVVAAGDTVGGRLVGFGGVVEVAIVRTERSPARERSVDCASVTLREGRAHRYTLELPADVPPTAAGRQCAIEYSITAKEALGDGRRAHAPVSVGAVGCPHLESRHPSADPMLANAPARRFHIELFAADLRGGGRISGRLHRHGRWAPGAFNVELSCIETWRALAPAFAGVSYWERDLLWSARAEVDSDPDRTWVPFDFDIPPDLPPAVEGHALAWRYELTAHRHARIGIDEYAALTPLLFETG